VLQHIQLSCSFRLKYQQIILKQQQKNTRDLDTPFSARNIKAFATRSQQWLFKSSIISEPTSSWAFSRETEL